MDDPEVGSYALTVTVDDGTNPPQAATVTIDITPVNDAPVVDQGIADQSVDEDTMWSFAVPAAAFADVDGDALTLTATLADGSALPAWLSFDGTRFTGTPPQDFNGDIALRVVASDGTDTGETTFTLTVNPVNDAPVVDQGIADQSVDEDTMWSFAVPAAAFADVDGDALTLTATLADGSALPAWLSFDGTSFTGTPPQDFNGDIALRVVASDGTDTGETTFTLTVSPVNDAPVASPVDLGAIDEDGSRVITAAELLAGVTDIDGPAATITALSIQSGNGELFPNGDGTWIYTPAADDDTGVTFAYTASDSELSASSTASLDLTPVNDAPVADAQSLATDEDTPIDGTLTATDVDSDGLAFAIVADSAVGGTVTAFDAATGEFTFTPDANFSGAASFQFTATDATDTSDPQTVTIDITPENDAPVVDQGIADQSVDEDTMWSFAVPAAAFADADGDALALTATLADGGALPMWLAFDGTSFTGTPPQDFNGDIALRVVASDGTDTGETTFTLTVNPVNDAPVVDQGIADQAVDEDTAWSFAVPAAAFTDVDGDALTLTATLADGSALPAWLAFDGTGFTGTPPQDFNGDIALRVVASDGTDTGETTFTLTVNPVNDAPVAADGSGSTIEDRLASGFLPAATDPDGDPVTYAAGSVAPEHGRVTIQPSGAYDYAPDDEFNGPDSFSYTVSDGNGGVNEYTFDITVTPVNDAPVGTSKTVTIDEDTDYVFSAADFGFADPFDNPANNFAAVIIGSAPLAGTLELDGATLADGAVVSVADINAGKLVFTPAPDGNGDGYDAFTFRVQDDGGTDNGGTDTSQLRAIHIDVNPLPDDPVAADDVGAGFVTDEETAFTTDSVLANDSDPDGDPLTLAGFDTTGTIGLVTSNGDGTFDYDPNGHFDGLAVGEIATDSFTYTVSDGTGREDTATVNVTINGVNDAPRAIDDSFGSNSDYDAFVVGTGEVYLGVNNGDGTFVTSPLAQDALTRDGAAFGDLNGDGNLDVFVAGAGPGAGVDQ